MVIIQKQLVAYNELKAINNPGYNVIGFIALDNFSLNGLTKQLPCFGTVNDLESIIHEKEINQVIIALEHHQQTSTEKIINTLSEYDIEIKLVPDNLEILKGSIKVNNVPGAVFIDINTALMPAWQQNIKRLS